jgi:hypothetical protein
MMSNNYKIPWSGRNVSIPVQSSAFREKSFLPNLRLLSVLFISFIPFVLLLLPSFSDIRFLCPFFFRPLANHLLLPFSLSFT